MAKWINYHHLYYFMTIAMQGGVSKAAQFLKIGQPTLSAQLQTFEEALGVKLFERKHKRLHLTESGRIALDYAKTIFKMGGEMFEALQDRLKPQKMNLRVGAIDGVPKQVLLNLAESARAFGPCHISLVEGKMQDLLLEVRAHKLDLLLTNLALSADIAQGLLVKKMKTDRVGIYGTQKFKPLKKDFPKSLAGKPFILPTFDSHLRYALEHWFERQNIVVDVVAESQDMALKKMMALSGMGLIPAAPYGVKRQLAKGELIEIGILKNLKEELYLISAKRKIENPVATHLMNEFHL